MRITIDLKPDSPVLKRLRDWSERKGCAIKDAALYVLRKHAEDALPTEAEDAEFEAYYANVQAEMATQETLEELPSIARRSGLN